MAFCASYASDNQNQSGNIMIGCGTAAILSGAAAIGYQARDVAVHPFACNDTARVVPMERALRLGAFGVGLVATGIIAKNSNHDENALSNSLIGIGTGLFSDGAAAMAFQRNDSQDFYAKRGQFTNRSVPQEGAILAIVAGASFVAVGMHVRKKR